MDEHIEDKDMQHKDNKPEVDGKSIQPRVKKLKPEGNVLKPEAQKEEQDFNHVEYANMISKQLKARQKPGQADMENKNKRPLLNPSKEALQDKKDNPKGHKGRIK